MDSPVSVLDAGTGAVLTEALPGTAGTDEMVLTGDTLVAVTADTRSTPANDPLLLAQLNNDLVAVNVETGRKLWSAESAQAAPYSLAAAEGCVLYYTTVELVCLDLATGRERWRVPASANAPRLRGGQIATVIRPDVALLAVGKQVQAFELADGQRLWERMCPETLAAAATQPVDIFVIGDTVWLGGATEGCDLRTGQVRKQINLHNVISPGHHRRCLRGKATVNYVIRNKRGSEFIDLSGQDNHMRNNWLRMPCFTGVTPANGMLYVPPSQCFCYPGVLMTGYLALVSDPVEPVKANGADALVRGPAFGKVRPALAGDADWPMYRRDNLRSGSTDQAVPAAVEEAWRIQLGSRATQPVIVGNRLWVAEKGANAIHCFDVRTGEAVYTFTPGGAVDSSPTLIDGMAVFGCRDGQVYCLRASDGELVWRFRAAPDTRQIISFEQLESLWPVHGSVLVQDGVAYFAAGRSSYLSGGMLAYGLDVKTGAVRASRVFDGPWPDIKTEAGDPFSMEGARPDIFVADRDKNLYMLRHQFDAALNVQPKKQGSPLGELEMSGAHLIATNGFLDDTNFDRIYWIHTSQWPGFYFSQHSSKAGQMVVFDDEASYAVKFFYRRKVWSPKLWPGADGYLLYSDDIESQPALLEKGQELPELRWLPEGAYQDRYRRGGRGVEKGTGYVSTREPRWKTFIPTRVRAMVLAGDHLVVAGPPDRVVAGDPLAAFENRAGAELRIVSKADGTPLTTIPLGMPPVFDGLSAANGQLFMATEDGEIICWR
jgi:outer membrane protein assembly factor BamB